MIIIRTCDKKKWGKNFLKNGEKRGGNWGETALLMIAPQNASSEGIDPCGPFRSPCSSVRPLSPGKPLPGIEPGIILVCLPPQRLKYLRKVDRITEASERGKIRCKLRQWDRMA